MPGGHFPFIYRLTTKASRSQSSQSAVLLSGSSTYLHDFQLLTYESLPRIEDVRFALTRLTIGAIFTIQPVSIILTIYFAHVIFHPSRPAVEAGDTRLQHCELIHHTVVGIFTVCSTRVT